MYPPLTGRGTAAWPSSARLRRDGKASAFGPCGPHRVPDSAAASPGGTDVSVCGEKACVSVCHSLPSHPWKPQSWARSPVQDALGVPARRSPAAHPWTWGWCGLRTGLFSFSHKVQGLFTVCFVTFETVCSAPQEQVANKTLDSQQTQLHGHERQGSEEATLLGREAAAHATLSPS